MREPAAQNMVLSMESMTFSLRIVTKRTLKGTKKIVRK